MMTDFHTPTFHQAVLADFIADGHFELHLRRTRVRNAKKRAALLAALEKHLGSRAQVVGASAGVHVVVWLPELAASRVDGLRRDAAHAGVGIYSVAPYYLAPPARAGLLFGYASLHERDMDDAIRLFRQVLDRARA
jgi:GntR family transcriptional regulator/MocR family aminotransferase